MKLLPDNIKLYRKYVGKKIKCIYTHNNYSIIGIMCGYDNENFCIITDDEGWDDIGANDFIHENYINRSYTYIDASLYKIEVCD